MNDIIKNEDLRAFIQSKIYVIRGMKVLHVSDDKGRYRRMEITNCDIQFHQNGTS